MLLDIAMPDKEKPVSLPGIAFRLGVSIKYLEKLSKILRQAGYQKSVVGSHDRYRLSVHPIAISMGDATFLLERDEYPVPAASQDKTDCPVKKNAMRTI